MFKALGIGLGNTVRSFPCFSKIHKVDFQLVPIASGMSRDCTGDPIPDLVIFQRRSYSCKE